MLEYMDHSPQASNNHVNGEFGANHYRSTVAGGAGTEDNMGDQIQGAISSLANVCDNFDRGNRRVSN